MHIYLHAYKYAYTHTDKYIYCWSIPQGDCHLYILYGKFETATIKLLVVLRVLNDCDIRYKDLGELN